MPNRNLTEVTSALMGVDEVCKILGISRNGAYDLIRKGNFPVRAFKVGERWKVNRAAFDAYIAGTSAQDPDGDGGT